MIPDDLPNDLDAFLAWPVTDQSAWLIGERLRCMAERREGHHGDQIARHLNDARPPPRDPLHPWR
ncbi:MAG: hypothetical protein KJ558_03160 [Gammaproteobacteria bacterium]|nr:hypothetical protein [Gammaproteobacteria bacterium]MBU1653825.1 hypothetical protein [Gammaproteobacteria bacterium]MBU1962153.1 hypothetical protein [Gammaproteobacteria bacterium]